MTDKRTGGLTLGKNWLVLTESKQHWKDEWIHKCGTEIESKIVNHPVHDGPFALSGSGKVHQEVTPYCPTCETEPSSSGMPIKG